jgi:acetyl-CoA C-acetyltransferase
MINQMRDVYIVSAARTAIGRFGGGLLPFRSSALGAAVIKDVVEKAKIDPNHIDEIILGNVYQAGAKGNPARQAAMMAGLPEEIPAMTINKQCGSGLRSISLGYQQILAGEADLIVAGGTESMSNVPHLLMDARWGRKLGAPATEDSLLYDGLHCAIEGYHMGQTGENLADRYQISREEQDQFALQSQEKALRAIQEGIFKAEIVPMSRTTSKGTVTIDTDEHPRATTLENLSKLPPAFKKGGSVTAGNASGINDGAAAVVIVSQDFMEKHDLTPLARIRSVASAGVDPSIMGIGPVPATKKALQKAGIQLDQLDLVELNEAFAAQALAVIKELKLNPEIVNVNGGAVALGHPVGCSGARIVVSLLHELIRTRKTLGLATLCIGGGQGTAMVIERV